MGQRRYTDEFKREAVRQVDVPEAGCEAVTIDGVN